MGKGQGFPYYIDKGFFMRNKLQWYLQDDRPYSAAIDIQVLPTMGVRKRKDPQTGIVCSRQPRSDYCVRLSIEKRV